jgi:hypothetical protein
VLTWIPTPPKAVTLTNGSAIVCEGETVNIKLGTKPQYVKWYRNNTLIAGATDSVYRAATSGAYYAVMEDSIAPHQKVGPTNTTFSTSENNTTITHLLFDAFAGFTLDSISVDVTTAQNYTFTLRNRAGVTLGSRTRSLVTGINKVFLGFAVPKDFDYQLGVASANGLKTFNGTNYPYNTNGLVSIKTSSVGTAKYLGLFDWIVRAEGLGCFVTSDTVNVTVNPRPVTSLTGASSNPFQLCEGNRLLLKASTGTGYTYQWTRNDTIIPFATADTLAVANGIMVSFLVHW